MEEISKINEDGDLPPVQLAVTSLWWLNAQIKKKHVYVFYLMSCYFYGRFDFPKVDSDAFKILIALVVIVDCTDSDC